MIVASIRKVKAVLQASEALRKAVADGELSVRRGAGLAPEARTGYRVGSAPDQARPAAGTRRSTGRQRPQAVAEKGVGAFQTPAENMQEQEALRARSFAEAVLCANSSRARFCSSRRPRRASHSHFADPIANCGEGAHRMLRSMGAARLVLTVAS